jgi:5-methylcytosine-specific restriction protein A
MVSLAALTERTAVLEAIKDFDRRGREDFLRHHQFGKAKWWYLIHGGNQYDSKAIVGVAVGIQTGRPLTTKDFNGGEGSVVRKLRSLGFAVSRAEVNDRTAKLPEETDETFPEGLRYPITVNRAERSARARLQCISYHGTACAVCDMTFEDRYGEEFMGLIHVHHLVPLGNQSDITDVNPKTDLVPVCPNCHAAIHFGGENRTLDMIRNALGRTAAKPR